MLSLRLLLLAALVTAEPYARPYGSSFGIAGENASYDYVVVGGGTAGLTIATRLAQDGRYSVAVIEAGGFADQDNGNRSSIPGYVSFSAGLTLDGVNPEIDWKFMTIPQPGAGGKSIHYTRGKTLGGSSVRNVLAYQRPTIGSFQKWADEVDDQSWTWKHVYKYFQKSTTFHAPRKGVRLANSTVLYQAEDFGDGPIQVGFSNYVSPWAQWVYDALLEVGAKEQPGAMSDGKLTGVSYLPLTIKHQSQERSTSQDYLELALKTTQLTIYIKSLATRINFEAKAAKSVQVETAGVAYTITATHEIILSAGALQSPQLLMVSGIGPAAILEKLGIPLIADRPGVGQNLQDNPFFGLSYPVSVDTISSYLINPSRFGKAVHDYNTKRDGFLTSAGADVISFHKVADFPNVTLSARAQADLAAVPADWPEVQIVSLAAYIGAVALAPQTDAGIYGSMIAGLVVPLSRGSITINSTSMHDPPVIDPRWLTHPTDQELAVAAIRRMRQIAKTVALRSVIVGDEVYPGPGVQTDEELLKAVQAQSIMWYHAAGTCKMGRPDDVMAVVDSKARVHGVDRLRVVDLSAIPELPPGQPQATVYMIAEKIADEILHEHIAGRAPSMDEQQTPIEEAPYASSSADFDAFAKAEL